jgi:Holliday junction resolvase
MSINSRSKGKRGELELAKYLRDAGYPNARRGQQFKGGTDSPDVVCPGLSEEFHIECKCVEAGNPYNWLAQAQRDANGKVPVVAHKKSRKEWVVILTLEDFLNLQLRRPLCQS